MRELKLYGEAQRLATDSPQAIQRTYGDAVMGYAVCLVLDQAVDNGRLRGNLNLCQSPALLVSLIQSH